MSISPENPARDSTDKVDNNAAGVNRNPELDFVSLLRSAEPKASNRLSFLDDAGLDGFELVGDPISNGRSAPKDAPGSSPRGAMGEKPKGAPGVEPRNAVGDASPPANRPKDAVGDTPTDQQIKGKDSPRPSDKRPEAKPTFNSTDATERELAILGSDMSAEKIKEVKEEIARLGRSPQEAIAAALKTNRVIAIGETHTDLNGMEADGRALIPKFAENKVTHLAVEMSKFIQPTLDKFLAGKIDVRTFSREIYGDDTRQSDNWLSMIKEAHDAGIKIVPVDDMEPLGQAERAKGISEKVATHRDEHMAGEISKILNADKNSKVVFWAGSNHIGTHLEGSNKTAADLLKEEFGSKGGVVTFGSNLESQSKAPAIEDLLPAGMQKAVSIDMSQSKALRDAPGTTTNRFDHAILYPASHTLQLAEAKFGKDDPRLLPHIHREAEFHVDGKNFAKALEMQERAVKIAAIQVGEKSAPFVAALNELGKTQLAAGNKTDGAKSLQQSFETAKELKDADQSLLMSVAANLAKHQLSENQADKAESTITSALDSLSNNRQVFQELSIPKGLRSEGRLKDQNPLNVADSLVEPSSKRDNAADQGARSERVLKALLKLEEAHANAEHPQGVVHRHYQLARLFEARGDIKSADRHFADALKSADNGQLPHLQIQALGMRGDFLTRHGRQAEATPLLERMVAEADKGKGTSDMIASRTSLAVNLASRERNQEAELHFKKALEIAEREDSGKSAVIQKYSAFLEKTGRLDEANKLKDLLRKGR